MENFQTKSKGFATAMILILGVIIIGGAYLYLRSEGWLPRSNGQNTHTVMVYFVDTKNPDYSFSCGVTRGVARRLGPQGDIIQATFKELMKGPTPAERAEGLLSTFEPSQGSMSGTQALADYLIGLSLNEGTLSINFEPEALGYLNSAACMQESVKKPIEETMRQFPEVKRIEYAIDGVIFEEWDA